MKIRDFMLAILLLFATQDFTFANRQLDRAEILQIFQTLRAQPRNTWIPAGTIEATHLAYNASSGYITDSNVIVKYDGDRFYWEININSHTRETGPRENSSRDYFDLNQNKRRVFTWDGERYTMYFRPGNHAIVTESPSDIPVIVNGPLTAGIVPWGYGIYTFESLLAAESYGEVDDLGRIHLTVNKVNMPEIAFVLDPDPAKNYPVLFCSMNYSGCSSTTKSYEDYQLVSGEWIPTTITIDRYDNSKQIPELLSHDEWDLTSISVSPPQAGSFNVVYETDALVEYHSPITDEPLSYRYSNQVDADSLLYDRLIIVAAGDTQTQNCATVAMKYVSARLGKDVTDLQLAELINEPNEGTSLYKLRQFAQGLGFHCLTVKTDITTLKNLNNCQAILHLPGTKHYVVLEHIDNEYVWLIDLDSNKFYYHTKLDLFGLDWSEGIALLISNEPLDWQPTFTELNDQELHKIIGGFPLYSCTELIQKYDVFFCSPGPKPIVCWGRYRVYYNRYGCELNEQGGSCTGEDLIGNVLSPCIEDPFNPGNCTITGKWYSQYMRACK